MVTRLRYFSRLRAALQGQASDPLSRDWATVFGGTLARLALGFVASLVVARALGPASFGVYATLGAATAIGGALADAGLSIAAVRRVAAVWPAAPELARQRGLAFLTLRLLIAAALVIGAVALAAPLAAILPGQPAPALVLLALLGVVATSLSGAISAMLQATASFRSLALVLMVNSGLTAALALGLAATGSLTLATVLGVLGIGTTLVSMALGWWRLPLRRIAQAPDRVPLRGEWRALFRFGGWVWLASGLSMLASSLDVLLIGRFLPGAPVGLYALAGNLASKADIVNQSMHTVLLPAASGLAGAEDIREYVRRSLRRSAAASLLLLPLLPLAEPLIGLFYGAAFLPAAGIFRVLLGVAIFDVWTTPLLLLGYTADRPRLLALADGLRVVTLLVCAMALIPALGLAGAALARLCARVAGAALILVALARGRAPRTAPPAAPPSLGS